MESLRGRTYRTSTVPEKQPEEHDDLLQKEPRRGSRPLSVEQVQAPSALLGEATPSPACLCTAEAGGGSLLGSSLADEVCKRPSSGSFPAWQDSGLPRRAFERRCWFQGAFQVERGEPRRVRHNARRSLSSCLCQRKSWDLHCLLWALRTWASSCRCWKGSAESTSSS